MNFIFSIITIILDQWTKKKAREELSSSLGVRKFNNLAEFRLVYNEGAFLGFLKEKKVLLNIITWGLNLILTVFFFPIIFSKKFSFRGLAYGLILGGALSNGYDRTVRGKVTDFVSFYPRFKVYFNVADFGIFIGAILSIIFDR